MPEQTTHSRPGPRIVLLVNRPKTEADIEAEHLVHSQLNADAAVVDRQNRTREVLPSLWVDQASYDGIDRIRYYIKLAQAFDRPARAR